MSYEQNCQQRAGIVSCISSSNQEKGKKNPYGKMKKKAGKSKMEKMDG